MSSTDKKYEIMEYGDLTVCYRNHQLTHVVLHASSKLNDIRITICRFHETADWWIVPNSSLDDYNMDAIGPFETPEDAVFYSKLISDFH